MKAAAAAGRCSTRATTCLAPPRPKLTTAAAEAAATTGKSNRKGKGTHQMRSTSNARKNTTAIPATAAAAASVLSVQWTPPETLNRRSTIPLNNAQPPHSTAIADPPVPPAPSNSKKTMLRHQQMTSLGAQTIQLLCIPSKTTSQQKHAMLGEDDQQQNQVPSSCFATKQSNDDELPFIVLKEAGTTATKPIASPRRHAHPGAKPKIKQRLKGTFYGSAQPPAARHRIRTVDDESDSDLDSFIETDEEELEESDDDINEENKIEEELEGQAAVDNADSVGTTTNDRDSTEQQQVHTADGDLHLSRRLHAKRSKPKKWKMALKEALNGYDASKFADVDAKPDRRMHASFEEILAEEARAGEIGREMDRIEAEKEREARAMEKERRQKRQQFVVLEDDNYSTSSGDDILSDISDEEEDGGVENRVRKRRKALAGFLTSF